MKTYAKVVTFFDHEAKESFSIINMDQNLSMQTNNDKSNRKRFSKYRHYNSNDTNIYHQINNTNTQTAKFTPNSNLKIKIHTSTGSKHESSKTKHKAEVKKQCI